MRLIDIFMQKWKEFFCGKKVTVFGLGLHGGGVGTVRFLASCGAKLTVTDIKNETQLAPSLKRLEDYKGIRYVLGQHRIEDFERADMIVKSPAIPWNNQYILHAQKKGIPVEMDSGLFFRFCKRPIIGVTGTKGKTTTSIIIYEILRVAGLKPTKVGVGQESVLDKLDELHDQSVVVFELSSWRLSALKSIERSPHIAVFKNFYPDHLNYYSTMKEYLEDKKRIFQYQKPSDFLVINYNDQTLKRIMNEAPSQLVPFSVNRYTKGVSVFVDEGCLYIHDGIDQRKILSLDRLKVRGKHNISNVMAAMGAAFAYGVDITKIRQAVMGFEGLPHRLEFIGEVNGVKYYDDTTATIPEAVMSALESFTQSVILIAGGSSKELKYEELARAIVGKVKDIILLEGMASQNLKREIAKVLAAEGKAQDIPVVGSMDLAVRIAQKKAFEGDVVVLSPGAASFGMFQNEFDRGVKFRSAVHSLLKEKVTE